MKHYAERDTEALGSTYIQHVESMTAEKLHSKSAIAAELAFRDELISKLKLAILCHENTLSLCGQFEAIREIKKMLHDAGDYF